jgi:hypothetical protein
LVWIMYSKPQFGSGVGWVLFDSLNQTSATLFRIQV